MDFFQNGSDELFHLSPFAELHESTIAPKYRPFPADFLSSGSLRHPNGMPEGESGPHVGLDIQSEASGDTVITEPYTYWNSTHWPTSSLTI